MRPTRSTALGSSPTPDAGRAERAGGADDADDRARVLVVDVGGGVLAIPSAAAQAVVRAGPVTPLGGVPVWVAGVTAVRGRVMAVADLSRLAGAAAAEGGEAWHVVVEAGGRAAALAGLTVRRVVTRLPEGDGGADEPPSTAAHRPGLPTRGVARLAVDDERGAAALPRWAPVLDVTALLDLIHDPPPRDGD